MTIKAQESYDAAVASLTATIAHIDAAIAVLNAPGKAIGYDEGLRSGQIGQAVAVRVRNSLAAAREDLAHQAAQMIRMEQP